MRSSWPTAVSSGLPHTMLDRCPRLYREHPAVKNLSYLLCYLGIQGLYFVFLVSLTKETNGLRRKLEGDFLLKN